MEITAIFEIVGTIAFAFSGAIVAIKCRLDMFGILCCAVFTATGGGMARDLILGNTPPLMFRDPTYVVIAAAIALLTAVGYLPLTKHRLKNHLFSVINVLDALGLAVFTIVGMQTAIFMGYGKNAFLVCFVGVVSAVGGGVFRDICTGRPPVIMQREIYATASVLGSLIYYYGRKLTISDGLASAVAMTVIFSVRMWAMRHDVNLPFARQSRR